MVGPSPHWAGVAAELTVQQRARCLCRTPDNEHRLCSWKSAAFWPLRLHSCPDHPAPPMVPAADCLFVLLVVIKVHLLISSTQSYYNIIAD